MKKIINIYLVIIAALLIITGCQKTPEITVVVNKNNLEQTIKDNEIPDTTVSSKNTEMVIDYNWPKSYSSDNSESSNFVINADVITSDAKFYPVEKAKDTAYSVSQIETFINKFANGTKLYRYEDVINTKEAIEEEIVSQKRVISDIESGKNKAFAGSIEQQKDALEELQNKLGKAPPEASLTPVSKFSELFDKDGGFQLASIDSRMNFIANNNNPRFIRFYINACQDTIALRDGDAVNTIPLSRTDAEKQAKEVLEGLGYDYMSLSETSAGVYLADYSENGENKDNSIYRFYFTRSVGDTPINYEETSTASSPSSAGEENTYSKAWPYEYISIAIDKNGVQEVIINGNLEIGDTVSKNVKLLDFNSMIEKAEAAVKEKYASYDDKQKGGFKYNIDTIKLGYMQVVSQNKTDEFMLIPVWDLFGTESYKNEKSPRTHHSFLTINAVNGSIIDRRFGY